MNTLNRYALRVENLRRQRRDWIEVQIYDYARTLERANDQLRRAIGILGLMWCMTVFVLVAVLLILL